MSWEDRIKRAVYTSPSGEIFVFEFEDVSKTLSKKTTAFDFPDVEGTYIQDLGPRGRRYPVRVIFWGADYDIESERFDNALEEKGAGTLQHPFYPGILNVVPVGDISRVDALKTAGNQAVYNIEFWETIEIVFPISELSAKNNIDLAIEEFSANAAADFDNSASIVNSSETAGLIASAKAGLRKVRRAMAKIAATTAAIKQQFDDAFSIIDDSIDTLVGTPTLLAAELIAITRLPSQASASIQAKLDSYTTLIASFTEGNGNQFEPSAVDSQPGNNFSLNDLLASTALISSIESTISDDADFLTRSGTIQAIESLQSDFENYVTWSDTNRENLSAELAPNRASGTNDLIDTGERYQDLQAALAIASGRLTSIAFTALQERSVILDRSRTIIDFAAEFYGEVDPRLDFIIESNKLSGSEILEIPKGRKMVYYV